MATKIDLSIGTFPRITQGDIVLKRKPDAVLSRYEISAPKHFHTFDLIVRELLRKIYIDSARFGFGVTSDMTGVCSKSMIRSIRNSVDVDALVSRTNAVAFESIADAIGTKADISTKAAMALPALDAIGLVINSSTSASFITYRLLSQMDDSTLAVFDEMTLNDVDYIVS